MHARCQGMCWGSRACVGGPGRACLPGLCQANAEQPRRTEGRLFSLRLLGPSRQRPRCVGCSLGTWTSTEGVLPREPQLGPAQCGGTTDRWQIRHILTPGQAPHARRAGVTRHGSGLSACEAVQPRRAHEPRQLDSDLTLLLSFRPGEGVKWVFVDGVGRGPWAEPPGPARKPSAARRPHRTLQGAASPVGSLCWEGTGVPWGQSCGSHERR